MGGTYTLARDAITLKSYYHTEVVEWTLSSLPSLNILLTAVLSPISEKDGQVSGRADGGNYR